MYRKLSRLFMLSFLIISLLLISCGRTERPPEGEGVENPYNPVGEDVSNELKLQLELESGVSSICLLEKTDWLIATILIEEGLNENKAEQLAKGYGQKIKERYPDRKVRVQIEQKKHIVYDYELE